MAKAPRSRKPRSVFVICESGSDVKSLVAVLQKLGLERLTPEDATGAAGSGVTGTRRLISSADIVCAVLEERNGPGVYFELGYALGLARPVVVIGELAALPAGATDQFWIKASPNDQRALSFQIQAFLENLNRGKPRRRGQVDLKTRTAPPASTRLLGSWKALNLIEKELLQALTRSAEVESIMAQPRHSAPSCTKCVSITAS
jgi:nucleoside 2-deoxyribosyltransferase